MIYFGLIIALLTLNSTSRLSPHLNAASKILAILLIVSFVAFRYRVGSDWANYEELYVGFNKDYLDPSHYSFRQGVVYNLVYYTARNLNFPFHYVTALYSIATLLFLFLSIDKFKYWWFSSMLYVLTPGYYLNSMSIIKQGLAITLCLYLATSYVKHRSKFQIVIVSLITAMAHHTTIVAVLSFYIIFNYHKYAPKKEASYYVLLFLSIIVGFLLKAFPMFFHSFLPAQYAHYVSPTTPPFGSGYDDIKTVVLFFYTIVLVRLKFMGRIQSENPWFTVVFIGYMIYFIFFSFPAITRLSYYFTISQIILIPLLLSKFSQRNKMILSAAALFYFFGQFVVALKINFDQIAIRTESGYSEFIPYMSIFDNI